MATRYWINSSSGNWNDTANWSTSSGGSGGASIPAGSDTAIFDSNGTGTCTGASNGDFDALLIDVQSGTHTWNFAADQRNVKTITIASGATVNANGTSSGPRMDNATFNVDGTFTMTGAQIRFRGTCVFNIDSAATWTLNSGAIYRNASTWTFSQACTWTGTINPDGGAAATFNMPATGEIIFKSDINLYSGCTWDMNNCDLALEADFASGASLTWTKGSGTITIQGTAAQDLDFNGATVEDMDIDKSSGTATLTANVSPDTLTVSSGTLALGTNNITTTGNVTIAAGTTLTGTGLITVGGNFAINGTSPSNVTFNGPDLTITGTATADYASVTNSDASGGTGVTATNSTDNGGNTNWTFGAGAVAEFPFQVYYNQWELLNV